MKKVTIITESVTLISLFGVIVAWGAIFDAIVV